MCGISGVVLKPNEAVDRSVLERMSSAMSRRGPDAQGVFAHQHFGFAHQRLKVIDLSNAANQPMISQSQKVILVFNGEVYNYRELRNDLERNHSRKFITESDTEVILQAYEVFGTDAFAKFNGMFALSILDLRESEPVLYLVRDHFGIKPLFYSDHSERLAFASELKPLLKLDWIGKRLDQDALFSYLKFSHVPCPLSIFKDVKQLEPGTFLAFRNGQSKITSYFNPKQIAHSPKAEEKTEREWLTSLDQCLKNVVSRQLVSDVPVGVFLSGGVDSSLLTLAATEVSGKAIDTFTIAYDEKEFDEGPFAREVAARAGSRHHEIKVGPKDLLNLIQDMPIFFDQPFADPTLLPSLILAKEARKVVTVGLSGDGGDELFFGYPYQRALQSMQRFRHTPLVLRKLVLGLASIPAHTLPTRLLQQWRKLNEILRYRNDSELLQYFIGTIGPVSLGRLEKLICGYTLSDKTQFYKMVQEISDLPWLQQVEQTFLRTFMCDTVLTKTDRTGMAYGLEGRVPFLDDEMVNFSANLPDHYKFRKGPSKYLLRKLLQTKMPGDLAFRKKRGFSIPLREWLNSDLRPLMDEYLDETRLTRDGLFDAKEVSRLVKEYRSGYANHSHLLFSFITFQLWKERYEV